MTGSSNLRSTSRQALIRPIGCVRRAVEARLERTPATSGWHTPERQGGMTGTDRTLDAAVGNDVVINLDKNDTLVLSHVQLSALTDGDFLFV